MFLESYSSVISNCWDKTATLVKSIISVTLDATSKLFDAFLCMYHDQALIPVKTIDFDNTINYTLGLSFVRTSPDHGTGYDIANKAVASETSLVTAINYAAKI